MTLRPALLAALCHLLLACRPAPAPPPRTRLEVRLHEPRDGDAPAAPDMTRNRRVDQVVELPEGPWLEHVTLRLDGLIGRAVVTVDDQAPVTVVGGPGPTDLHLAGLSAGSHRIRVEAAAAPDLSPVRVGGDGPRTPPMLDPPLLLLRPQAHVESLALPVRDGQVTGRARVAGAPEGAVVRFVITRDGRVVQDLGRAPVVEGLAATAPQRLRAPTWSLQDPELVLAHAVLEAGDGRVLDAMGARTGLVEVALTDRGFRIGGREHRLLATRAGGSTPPGQVILDAMEVGANAVEFHGTPATRAQLDALDEVGLAAILTHRCDGALRRVLRNEEIGEHLVLHEATLADQDRRLSWEMARHPAVALWVTEAVAFPRLAELMVEADPLRRPVVGADLPLMTVMDGPGRQGRSYAGSFIVESAWNGPTGSSADLAVAFLQALDDGARGGVVEHNREPERVAAWAQALVRADEARPEPWGRRRQTPVEVAGAAPHAVAWLEAPWLVADAAVVDDQGRATLSAWYEGPATLRIAGSAEDRSLRAPAWSEDFAAAASLPASRRGPGPGAPPASGPPPGATPSSPPPAP